MKTLKKGIALLLGIMLCISLLPAAVYAVSDDTEEIVISEPPEERSAELMETSSGTCGDNLTWVLDDEGTLTISGTGDMYDWTYDNMPPWNDYASRIKKVVINSGVTSVGGRAFYNCFSVTSIEIPNGVTGIGCSAFYSCDVLRSITIPSGVTSIGSSAFSYCKALRSVEIPSGVTSIDYQTFYCCKALRSVTLSNGLTNIGEQAFSECTLLTEILIPGGVESIESAAFKNCTSLRKAALPDSVTSIGDRAFSDCVSLTEVAIPNGVTSIGAGVFGRCSSLTEIVLSEGNQSFCTANGVLFDREMKTLIQYPAGKPQSSYAVPEGVEIIGGSAFSGCSFLAGISLPSSLTTVENSAFSYCTALESCVIPAGVTSVGNSAFQCCSALRTVSLPEGLTSIYNATFNGCEALQAVSIPNSVTGIWAYAFSGCTSLSDLRIGDGVTGIGTYAFAGCSSLKDVALPVGLTKINERVFYGCTGLESITIPEGIEAIEMYAFSGCTSLKEVAIPGSASSVGGSAFENCSALTDVYISDGVQIINYSVFYKCSSLRRVSLPASLTKLGGNAFSECGACSIYFRGSVSEWNAIMIYGASNLASIPVYFEVIDDICTGTCGESIGWELDTNTGALSITGSGEMAFTEAPWYYLRSYIKSVTIGPGITTVGESAFSRCQELASAKIPDSVTRIEGSAFAYCSALSSISIPDSVTSIGESAFRGCKGLSGVVLPAELTSIENLVFFNCSGLTHIAIPAGVASIGNEAFSYCRGLTEVTIPTGVTSIGSSAFSDCSGLTHITIPNSVTSIGETSFRGCSGLTSVTIPDGVTSIGTAVFYGCSSLTSITIPVGVTSIGSSAFSDCSGLTGVTIPATVTSIDYSAFQRCYSLSAISVAPGNTAFCSVDGVLFDYNKTKLQTYPAGRPDDAYLVPDGVATIGRGAFSGCQYLKSVELSGSVTKIEESAFSDCQALEYAVIADHVTSIGRFAFSRCHALKKVMIPNSVTQMGYDVFCHCEGLVSAGPTGSGCSIEFGWTDALPVYAFESCERLTSVILPAGLTSIGGSAFSYCYALSDITLPASLTSIGRYAFQSCVSLEHISIPGGVRSVVSTTFDYCTGLKDVVFRYGVERIEEKAFAKCTALTGISLPESVSFISGQAFYECPNLRDVFYEGTAEAWQALTEETGLEGLNVSSWSFDESLAVTITTENVPGGIKVSMDAPGGEIYYTLDGTTPGQRSIFYQGPFMLGTAGNYTIKAIAIDISAGAYGNSDPCSVRLERSRPPEIYRQGDTVYMSADLSSGGIYYNSDLSREPDLDSARYTGPIALTRTRVFRARAIENGKAKSEVVSCSFKVTGKKYTFPDDSYSFPNTTGSFGYTNGFRIGKSRYLEIFGYGIGSSLYADWGEKWNGLCFGMSATSLMFSNRVLELGDYSDRAQKVNALLAPRSPDSELTKLIERYQVAQLLPVLAKERNDRSEGGNMVISGLDEPGAQAAGDRLIDAVRKSCSGEEPIILFLWKSGLNGCHAVVPYKLETEKIYIYDCNRPNTSCVLSYSKDGGGLYRFSYGEYSYAVSYNTLNMMLEELEGLQTGTAKLQADGKEQMLVSLNTGSLRILDSAGEEVTDYITVRSSDDGSQAAKTMLYLDVGGYTILNTDGSLGSLGFSAATEKEYHTVTVADSSAQIFVAEENGHLSVSVTAEGETAMTFHLSNSYGKDDEIRITADRAKVYASSDMVALVETSAASMIVNGETVSLAQGGDDASMYFGAVWSFTSVESPLGYVGYAGIRLSTDIGELLEDDFTLTANVTGAGERARVFAASYDAEGRMTLLQDWETEAGKTKYPFTIAGGTAEVKIFLLDLTSGEPLTESLTIKQG